MLSKPDDARNAGRKMTTCGEREREKEREKAIQQCHYMDPKDTDSSTSQGDTIEDSAVKESKTLLIQCMHVEKPKR